MPFDEAQADKTAIAATATIITTYFFIFIKFKITDGVKVKVFTNHCTQIALFLSTNGIFFRFVSKRLRQ